MKAYFEIPENLAKLQYHAATWLHTPFMPNGAVKGAGVSCQKLVGSLYIESGVWPAGFVLADGPMDWASAQKTSLIADFMDKQPNFQPVPSPAQPGDMIGFKLGGCVHHCGIMLFADGKFVHCLRQRGTIISNLRDATYFGRIERIWRPVVAGILPAVEPGILPGVRNS
jgi:hypothetical protein